MNEIKGTVDLVVKTEDVDVVLYEILCTSCGVSVDPDDATFVVDENDDDYVVLMCLDCDEVVARFRRA